VGALTASKKSASVRDRVWVTSEEWQILSLIKRAGHFQNGKRAFQTKLTEFYRDGSIGEERDVHTKRNHVSHREIVGSNELGEIASPEEPHIDPDNDA
jgi:hypothetical protein